MLTSSQNGNKKKIRLLHVVENLDNQATENWLVRIFLRSAQDNSNFHWTFFCTLGREGKLDEAVRKAGGEVIHSRFELHQKLKFMVDLRRVMKEGRYDILHCHHDIVSAVYLLASTGLPFKKRIVHLHNTSLNLPTPSTAKIALLRGAMRQICLRRADQIIGVSKDALHSLVHNGSANKERHCVVHCGVDTSHFSKSAPDPIEFRQSMGFKPSAKIMLFVGRLVSYKNPCFVVEILDQLATSHPEIVAIFAGTGEEELAVRKLAQEKSLSERIKLLGFRDDVPRLMQACDVLLWPSLEEPKEGLGLGIIEAQAAGLPVLMSRSVPEEAIVVSKIVKVLPLAAGNKVWADEVAEILTKPKPSKQDSLLKVQASTFSMQQGMANLMELYH